MSLDTEFVRARSKSNGGLYTIGMRKYLKSPHKWELVHEEKVRENKKEVIQKLDELSYKELKEELTELGVAFKGNSSKDTLLELLKEVK